MSKVILFSAVPALLLLSSVTAHGMTARQSSKPSVVCKKVLFYYNKHDRAFRNECKPVR